MKERFIIISNNFRSFASVYESDTEEIAHLFSYVTGQDISGTPTTQPSLDDLIKALQQHSTLKNAPSLVYDSAHPTDLFFSLEENWNRDKFPFEITFNEQADLNKLEAGINNVGVRELVGFGGALHQHDYYTIKEPHFRFR